MEIPEKQMESILLGLIQKGLIKTHECVGWDSKTEEEVVGLLLYPTWRTYDFYGELDDEHIKHEFGGKDPRDKEDETPLTHAMRVSPFMKEYTQEMEVSAKGGKHPECEWKPNGTSNVELVNLHERPVHVDRLQREDRRNPTWWPPHCPNNSWNIKDVKAYFDSRALRPTIRKTRQRM